MIKIVLALKAIIERVCAAKGSGKADASSLDNFTRPPGTVAPMFPWRTRGKLVTRRYGRPLPTPCYAAVNARILLTPKLVPYLQS